MTCPRCKTRGEIYHLKKANLENIEIDICENCGGIWFDKSELGQAVKISSEEIQKLTNILENTNQVEKEDVELNCPRCDIPMMKYRYMYTSNIYIDSCEKCEGIWIDKGELIQIINYLEESSKIDPEKEAAILQKISQIKMEYQLKEKEFVDSLVRMDNTARNPVSKAFGGLLQAVYSFLYKKGL
ncbi:MAG: zf-TFIIB domain-containing protein [bacterium]